MSFGCCRSSESYRSGKLQVLAQSEIGVQGRLVPDEPDSSADAVHCGGAEVRSEDYPAAARGAKQSCHDPQEGRLAGTVRSEQGCR